ncbi:AAA domain-containing protein [Ditylenchus destructor]|uniref:Adenylate kinase isoenzyme 6 homolog n=1 Tax=Ditylenchus destructor TaxID=166010 RepID=A0AAD4R1V8_9BILA|nr:AAA domain-containing protein [Ditylenchus destructor]
MATSKTRKRPNVLITGTPGTGKTTLATRFAENINFEHIDIARIVKENKFHTEFAEKYQSYVLDEDKLLDFLEDQLNSDEGGLVLDYHSSEFFPERWFDFVIVLRCENTQVLYDRLAERNYATEKTRENVECEIFGIVAEEAREAYPEGVVHELNK